MFKQAQVVPSSKRFHFALSQTKWFQSCLLRDGFLRISLQREEYFKKFKYTVLRENLVTLCKSGIKIPFILKLKHLLPKVVKADKFQQAPPNKSLLLVF